MIDVDEAAIVLERGGSEPLRNSYISVGSLDAKSDYWSDILAEVENSGLLVGYTFYVSVMMPHELPTYGPKVVLIVHADEQYQYRWFFTSICAVLRSYGACPRWLYGVPSGAGILPNSFHFIYKLIQCLGSVIKASVAARQPNFFLAARARILHTPLGTCFRMFESDVPVSERAIPFAFLGSLAVEEGPPRGIRRLLPNPKTASRRGLMSVLRQVRGGRVAVTETFHQSVQYKERYVLALADCKISICPRGSNPETYRFYESVKNGCVVVGEPLPRTWFLPDHPGVTLKSWAQLPRLIQELQNDPVKMEELACRSRQLWADYMSERAVASRLIQFIQSLSQTS